MGFVVVVSGGEVFFLRSASTALSLHTHKSQKPQTPLLRVRDMFRISVFENLRLEVESMPPNIIYYYIDMYRLSYCLIFDAYVGNYMTHPSCFYTHSLLVANKYGLGLIAISIFLFSFPIVTFCPLLIPHFS